MQDSYVKLMERMNKNDIKHPVTNPMLDALRVLYNEEQAALIGDFPLGAHTSQELSGLLRRDETVLDQMLKEMSAQGLIFEAGRKNGDKEYSVLPFEPGLMEMQLLKGEDNERQRKMLNLIGKAHAEENAILAEILKQPERVREEYSSQIGRIIGVEEVIAADKQVVSWDKLSSIVENATSYAVGECGCKHGKKLLGYPCKSEAPSKCCVWFNKTADYLADRGYVTRINKDEVYTLFKICQEAGLVNFTSNLADTETVVVCNCCKCCCSMLRKDRIIRKAGIDYGITASSNFRSFVNEETCVGCGTCVDFCQMKALKLIDDKLKIDPRFCLGCGICVKKCPTESISLVRISSHTGRIPEIPLVGAGV
ncbi:MAG: hypothetical protein CVU54_18570 [Deltaproteobacteria bacterium HGW-Deltaproteobacteria-12]|jgi:Pyruvate/2-oxoacid:ferredoxin oxidoreductase delta subunit|nr:MAG: hypothetical protein CVU54_18570 [Deltaproteobacteria bacterium HGW-Deltaproteobacteria-12]